MKKDLTIIDIDLINKLRSEKKFFEANNLIAAHQESLKKNRLSYKRELFNNHQRVTKLLKKRNINKEVLK